MPPNAKNKKMNENNNNFIELSGIKFLNKEEVVYKVLIIGESRIGLYFFAFLNFKI